MALRRILAVASFLHGLDAVVELLQLGVQISQPLFEQRTLAGGEPGPQGVPASSQHIDDYHQRSPLIARGHQGSKESDLLLGLQHQLMGAVEILIMSNQSLNSFLDRRNFQHVLPHEFGEVAYRLHRDRLME